MKKNPQILQAPDLRSVMTPKQLAKKAKLQAPDLRIPAKKNPLFPLLSKLSTVRDVTKKNPAPGFVLMIQKAKGPVMTWNGERFTNNPPYHAFKRASAAKIHGEALLAKFPVLKDYRIWVAPKVRTYTGKKNPSPRANAELDQATKKLEDFTGHPVKGVEKGRARSSQKTGLVIGELDLIGYRAKRDGEMARYGHHFKKASRPLLAVTSDGKQLHIVGGRYEFTEAGIEDR